MRLVTPTPLIVTPAQAGVQNGGHRTDNVSTGYRPSPV